LVGAILNSLRSSLDLLAAALAARNGKQPSADTHFPIFLSAQDMIDPLTGIERKKWLSESERTAIKALKPHQGGDSTIWPLHQLDILRKHQRLIAASADVHDFVWERGTPGGADGYILATGLGSIERLKDKTVLFRYGGAAAKSFDPPKGYTHIASKIVFNEAALGMTDYEVAPTLIGFAGRVAEIVKLFDLP
jgi:hypothetical protein